MNNWYLYYRLMHALRHHNDLSISKARIEMQDVLCDLLYKSQLEWPNAEAQEIQDFFEYLSINPTLFTEREAKYLTLMEPWAN